MKSPKNILIVRTDRIGDVVLSLPMAAIIKKHFPGCRITFLLRRYTEPLAVNNPYIDEVIALIEKNGKPSISKNIYVLKNEFDAVVVAYPSYAIALMLFLSNIKIRIGSGYRWYSFFFNRKVYDHRKFGEHHELEYNVRLLRQLGIKEEVNENNVQFGIAPHNEDREKIERVLSELKVDPSKKIVIVHPGSGGSAVDLPAETMKSIIKTLSNEPFEIFITGNEQEKELCSSLVVNNSTKNLAGNFNLGELIALIEKCDLMIANSTGPIHIAAGLGKYVIGFYPKFAAASPKRWSPYTTKKKIFTPEIDCQNCTRRQCENLRCMESIKAEDVVEAAKLMLAKVKSEN
ncbi:MAG: ADP-heptose--LPS heptosyltransferase [Ignavibacteriae bacterium HGW-Ignavibacteriae-3]|nr:MAG: ADP-heptose--LPS heptosyltransferase [Ignavibacteriae bacterium HGW-Ignavibacteriae-3]